MKEPQKLTIKVETNLDEVEAQLKRIEDSIDRISAKMSNLKTEEDDRVCKHGRIIPCAVCIVDGE